MFDPVSEALGQQLNDLRIKLDTLRACYDNLAESFHVMLALNDSEHNVKQRWTKCNAAVCQSNFLVLTNLGLK